MPNIASALKTEISRVARRGIKTETAPLKKATAGHRGEIASLKRRLQSLEQQIRRLSRTTSKAVSETAIEAENVKHRFSAKGLVASRKRLGVSGADIGLLLGASPQSIYNWEQGKARPQARHLPAIAALKTMARREAAARLEAIQG